MLKRTNEEGRQSLWDSQDLKSPRYLSFSKISKLISQGQTFRELFQFKTCSLLLGHPVRLFILPILLTILLTDCRRGCHLADNMKFPDFSRPRLSSTVGPRPFTGVWGHASTEKFQNQFQTAKIPLLCPDFWNSVDVSWQIPWLLEVSFKFPDFSRLSRSLAILYRAG